MNTKRLPRRSPILFICGLFVFLYQNCGQLESHNVSDDLKNLQLSATGNGTGYDGKLGSYYNFVPGFNCDGQDNYQARIDKTATGYRLTRNSLIACGTETKDLLVSDLDFSPYHQTLAGYQDQIFEFSTTDFTKTPDRLVEAWCFDSSGEKKIEIIQQYNQADQSATAKLYYSLPDGVQEIPTFATSRLVESQEVIFQGSNYQLKINRQKPGSFIGSFNASLQIAINGTNYNNDMSCRLGGYLDSNLWPAKVIIDGQVSRQIVSPVSSKIYGIVTSSTFTFNIYENDLSGQSIAKPIVGLTLTGYGADEMNMSPDGNYIIYRDHDTALYAYHIPTSRLLTVAPPSAGLYIARDFKIFDDQVFFTTYSSPTPTTSRTTKQRASLLTGDIVSFYDTVGDPNLTSEGQSKYSEANHSLIFSKWDSKNLSFDFFSIANDSKVIQKITPDFSPDFAMKADWYSQFTDNYIFYTVNRPSLPTDPIHGELFVSSVHGGPATGLGLKGYLSGFASLLSQGKTNYIQIMNGLAISNPPQSSYIVSVDSSGNWSKQATKVLSSIAATRDAFYGLDGKFLYQLNATTGEATNICPAAGPIQEFIVGKSSKIYILASNPILSSVYVFDSQSGCHKLNDAPFDSTLSPKLFISPDETQALVQDIVLDSSKIYSAFLKNEIYWVPLNGQSIVRITTPDLSGTSDRPIFTPDSKSIIFMARPFFATANQLFVWQAPKLKTNSETH